MSACTNPINLLRGIPSADAGAKRSYLNKLAERNLSVLGWGLRNYVTCLLIGTLRLG
jgi:hypothetical protein